MGTGPSVTTPPRSAPPAGRRRRLHPVRGQTGDQTGQESRSAGHRAAASMTVMDITIVLEPPFAPGGGLTDDERRTIVEVADHSDRDDAERDGKQASLFMTGVRRPLRGSLASSVLATVRPLSPPAVHRLGLVRRTEVLRNG